MITQWLSSSPRGDNPHSFMVVDIFDTNTVDMDHLVDYLSDRLVGGLVEPERLEQILQKAGLDKLLDQLRSRVVVRKFPVLVGDFGEILLAEILKELDGYTIPIAKLRFREKRNWPMRLTDVLAIKHDGQQLIELCLCEVKTRTAWNKKCEQVGLDAYKELENEAAQRIPEIVDFVVDKLRLMQNYDLADVIDTFLLSDDPAAFPRTCIVALLFDSDIWNETVLTNIVSAPVKLDHFSTKVVRISQLRKLIDSSYSRVTEKHDGQSPVPATG